MLVQGLIELGSACFSSMSVSLSLSVGLEMSEEIHSVGSAWEALFNLDAGNPGSVSVSTLAFA
jgi:hypothetical protein